MTDRDYAGSRNAAVAQLAAIRAALPTQLHAHALAGRAKAPFKVALYRDSLLWRIDELGHSALAAYDDQHHVAAIMLTRGAIESVAALDSVHHLVTSYRGGDLDSLDDKLMKMVLGSRTREDRPQALNILTAIDRLGRRIPTFRWLYDELSEFAHPNDAGTASSFAKINRRGDHAIFRQLGEDPGRRAWLLIESLSTTLMLVMPLYSETLAKFALFTQHCEADVADL